ncbi:hypothetical protein [Paenibacillus sp. NEAU-GSW1]|uniref:hypothetical protein n=1 Tax=Paenibacillus sp. NEAU-GSW1 TaxID=2682486 RepID=UPI0012E2434C|nr:hypothetical protein [Paenibacillus sp. NEAU-GSW1]MUT66627.1 hypothetical protein [Paenibacillus sp. NEAU-GSW1]
MNIKRFGLSLFLLALLTTFIIGCSKNQQKDEEIIFFAEGENWNAQFTTTTTQTSKENIVIDYFYKGNISELSSSNEIVFSYGTANGSIAEPLHIDKIDKAHFSIEFEGDLIHGEDKLVNIVGKSNENIMSIIEWNDKSETLHLTQFVRK